MNFGEDGSGSCDWDSSVDLLAGRPPGHWHMESQPWPSAMPTLRVGGSEDIAEHGLSDRLDCGSHGPGGGGVPDDGSFKDFEIVRQVKCDSVFFSDWPRANRGLGLMLQQTEGLSGPTSWIEALDSGADGDSEGAENHQRMELEEMGALVRGDGVGCAEVMEAPSRPSLPRIWEGIGNPPARQSGVDFSGRVSPSWWC
jgi:hypothetical protein